MLTPCNRKEFNQNTHIGRIQLTLQMGRQPLTLRDITGYDIYVPMNYCIQYSSSTYQLWASCFLFPKDFAEQKPKKWAKAYRVAAAKRQN